MGTTLRWVSFLVAVLSAAAGSAAIYKWIDDNGGVHYSEKPPRGEPTSEISIQPIPQYVEPIPTPKSHVRARTEPKGRPSRSLQQLGPLPENKVSKYLETVSTGFATDAKRQEAQYSLMLKARSGLPFGAVLIVHFENPNDQENPFVKTVRRQGGDDELFVMSTRFKGLKCANYLVEIFIYRTSAKGRLLGTHRQFVQSRVNLDKVRSLMDLLNASRKGNCP
jgi:hypothetical protein